MKSIYLPSPLFLKVLYSEECQIVHIVTGFVEVRQKVAIVEGRENCPAQRSPSVFRYIKAVSDSEFITSDEIICTLTLSSKAPSI